MLVKDLIAQGTLHRTIDLLEGMMSATNPKRHRTDVHVRAYVVGSYWRKCAIKNKKIINIQTLRKQRKLKQQADKILLHGRA